MIDYVHEHFKKYPDERIRPHIVCKDGTVYSVQASSMHYCTPREDNEKFYSAVEVWLQTNRNTQPEGWVPVENVNRRIHRRGGVEQE